MAGIKMQYPVALAPDTKCPSCGQQIVAIGPQIYSCHTGHVLEPYILITMTPRAKQPPVKLADDEPKGLEGKPVTKQ